MFKALTLTYATANLDHRGLLSLTAHEQEILLERLKQVFAIEEALVVSTCNRLECYYNAQQELSASIIKLICSLKGVSSKGFLDLFMRIDSQDDTIRHLYHVAMGLESMILGDIQIFGQVKKAYQLSVDMNMAGQLLHRVMHSIFHAHKEVCQSTTFKDGSASASYMVTKIIRDQKLGNKKSKILVVGAGEMGSGVCKNLASLGFENVTIANRTFDRAKRLSEELEIDQITFEQIHDELNNIDILISTISADLPIFRELKSDSHFHCFDLANPRSMSASFLRKHATTSFDIDEISACTDSTIRERLDQVELVKSIVQNSIQSFKSWQEENKSLEGLREFKSSLEKIRKDTLAQYIKKMDESNSELVEDITQSIIQKIIKVPALQLRQACMKDDTEQLSKALLQLFNPLTQNQKTKP